MAVDPPFRIKNMVPGMIMLWHGSIASIPSGWHLCDGTMGTPNLHGRYVKGAGGILPPGTRAGSSFHSHTFTGDGHFHDIDPGATIAAGADYAGETTSDSVVGTTDIVLSDPEYHALCYIMKL